MIRKLKRFVASLTDQEIDLQLADILEWARVYKDLLENERENRQEHQTHTSVTVSDTVIDADNEYEKNVWDAEPEDISMKMSTVDYALAQMVQKKVSSFSAEETREQLEKLHQIFTDTLSPEEIDELQYEIEACELHLFEITGETADGIGLCPACGAELETNACFCGKCGTAISKHDWR